MTKKMHGFLMALSVNALMLSTTRINHLTPHVSSMSPKIALVIDVLIASHAT